MLGDVRVGRAKTCVVGQDGLGGQRGAEEGGTPQKTQRMCLYTSPFEFQK